MNVASVFFVYSFAEKNLLQSAEATLAVFGVFCKNYSNCRFVSLPSLQPVALVWRLSVALFLIQPVAVVWRQPVASVGYSRLLWF